MYFISSPAPKALLSSLMFVFLICIIQLTCFSIPQRPSLTTVAQTSL